MEFQDKLELLGGGAADDVACQSCAANPNASIVTHRGNQPLTPSPSPESHAQKFGRGEQRPRDLKPWLSSVIRSDGKKIVLVKTLMTSACEKDCFYCATRRGRNSLRRETFKPEELAAGFNIIHQRGFAEGLFLSSGVIGGGTRTMEKTIAAVDILRRKYEFRGYVHLKLMPGAERAAIERAIQLADRVSVNLEAPNTERLAKLSSTKQFSEELLAPLHAARALMRERPELARTSMVTQFVVGAADETDREILATTTRLYRELQLARVYYSAFKPVDDTPLENHAPTNPLRELRLYQTDFLLRRYGFTLDELAFDAFDNLPLDMDPKMHWAVTHPEKFPLDVQWAGREELLRVPGLGPKSVERVIRLRQSHTFTTIQELKRLGADAERAAPFILLNGNQPIRQLALFGET
ncbi:MAG: radical SAM protein [Chloroflexi bacterium]|nr:radical SAM protein [Chloroflexota bacterium]